MTQNECFSEILKKVHIHFDEILRTEVVPPIKGEITKGKTRWRGIRMNQYKDNIYPYTVKYWMTQRGEKIGKEFIIGIKI